MNILTLEQITPFLAHNIKGHAMGETTQESEFSDNPIPEEFTLIGLVSSKASICSLYGRKELVPLEEFFPILRRLDLTKPILIEGKEVIPIVELAKLSCNVITYSHEFEFENNGDLWCNLYNESGGVVIWCLIYNVFHGSFRLYEDEHNYDQFSLFQWLAKHKFNFVGIADELVVYTDTLSNDPYN